jgi:hypothetical protein
MELDHSYSCKESRYREEQSPAVENKRVRVQQDSSLGRIVEVSEAEEEVVTLQGSEQQLGGVQLQEELQLEEELVGMELSYEECVAQLQEEIRNRRLRIQCEQDELLKVLQDCCRV